MKCRCLVVGGIAASAVWSAGMGSAEACSEPQPGVVLEEAWLEGMPLDGAIVARLDRPEDDWSVIVTGADGEPVEGSVREVSYGVVGEYEWRSALLVWTPEANWEPEQTYSVEIELEADYATGQPWERAAVSFTTGQTTMASQDAFSSVQTTFSAPEKPTRSECCARECETAACEWGSDCRDCWGVAYAPHPTVTSTLQIDALAADALQYMVLIKDAEGDAIDERWMRHTGEATVSVTYPPDAPSPYCAHVEVTRLTTGEVFTLEPICVEAPARTSFEEVERGERPAWVTCSGDDEGDSGDVGEESDAGDFGDAGGQGDGGQGDASGSGDGDASGGCSVSGSGAGGGTLVGLLAMLTVSLRRRRR